MRLYFRMRVRGMKCRLDVDEMFELVNRQISNFCYFIKFHIYTLDKAMKRV